MITILITSDQSLQKCYKSVNHNKNDYLSGGKTSKCCFWLVSTLQHSRSLVLQVTLWPSASLQETRNKVRTPMVRYIQTARGPGGIAHQHCSLLTADSCVTATRAEARVTSREPSLRVWVATPEGTALHKRADKGISSPPFVSD